MLTLHSVTEETRAIFKWGGIILGTVILLLMFINLGQRIKEIFYPTPPPPPTVSFGKLQKLEFPSNATDQKLTFKLDTVTGKLPAFEDRAKVYKLKQAEPNLLDLDSARTRLFRAGFLNQETPLAKTVYSWTDGKGRKIIFDIVTSDFSVLSDIYHDKDIIGAKNLPNEDKSIKIASTFLSGFSLLPTDLDLAKTKTSLFSIKKSILAPATSLSTAQVIRVDFFQKDFDEFPILYSNYPLSTMNILVGSGEYEGKVIEASFFHQYILDESATYPIKTSEEAFAELENGKAFVQSFYSTKPEVIIKKVYLTHYLTDRKQGFLQPIIVFEGNDGFMAYIQAVKEDWTEFNK